ncbi:hypothetical protein CRUP_013491, partial [Coryphaenoides rupestris]
MLSGPGPPKEEGPQRGAPGPRPKPKTTTTETRAARGGGGRGPPLTLPPLSPTPRGRVRRPPPPFDIESLIGRSAELARRPLPEPPLLLVELPGLCSRGTDRGIARRPDSTLRARYGTQAPLNAVHGSEDGHQASREIALLFPDFRRARAAEWGGQEGCVERTLALIRLAAARDHREEQMRHFYLHHADDDHFTALQLNMTSGPVLALVLARENAVKHWRDILGPADLTQAKEDPDCLRAQFAVEGEALNQLHGSESTEEAQREIDFFFPCRPDSSGDLTKEIRSSGFSVSRMREEVLSREAAEELYQEQREQPFFSQLLDTVCGWGPCLVLELTKENAVEEWRALMGPAEVRETAPGSLRARFSYDVLHNAVHGSSSARRAEEHIRLLLLGD